MPAGSVSADTRRAFPSTQSGHRRGEGVPVRDGRFASAGPSLRRGMSCFFRAAPCRARRPTPEASPSPVLLASDRRPEGGSTCPRYQLATPSRTFGRFAIESVGRVTKTNEVETIPVCRSRKGTSFSARAVVARLDRGPRSGHAPTESHPVLHLHAVHDSQWGAWCRPVGRCRPA